MSDHDECQAVAEWLDDLPTRVKRWRQAHDLTTRKAAEQAGVVPSTLWRLEAGRHIRSDVMRQVLLAIAESGPPP